MSQMDNLGGKSVASIENSRACYLAVWRHAFSPPLESFEF